MGSGRGAVLFPAAERVGQMGQVDGIDLAETMVQETAVEVTRRGLLNTAVLQMDAEHLIFPAASFDAVLCSFGIFLLDIDRALSEFHRVLRPGGCVGLTCADGLDERWRWYNDLLITYHDAYGIPLSPRKKGAEWTPADLPAILARHGFGPVQATTEIAEFISTDAQEWWHAKWTHGARYPLERMSPDTLQRFQADVWARLAQVQQTSGFSEQVRMLTVVGRRLADARAHG